MATEARRIVVRQIAGAGPRSRPAYGTQWRILILTLLLLDGATVYLSLQLAYSLRISSGLLDYAAAYNPVLYNELAGLAVGIWLVLFWLGGLYRRDMLLGGAGEYEAVARACITGVVCLVLLTFFWRDFVFPSRGWLLLALLFSSTLLSLERFLARRVAYRMRQHGWFTARTLIVGANEQGTAIAEQWLRSPVSGMAVVGFLDDFKPIGAQVVNGLKVLGRPSALVEVLHDLEVHEVIVVSSAVAWESFEEIIAQSPMRNGHVVRLSPGFYELLATGVAVTNKTFVPLLTINERRLVGSDAGLKRLLDYGLGGVACAAALPVMAVICLALRCSRGRPVLDRYRMLGLGGAPFTMYKFHTGPADPAGSPGPPRSRLQALLLQSGLDKLPQLFNVLAGKMGLVGPRPRMAGESVDLWLVTNLHSVKPGIIGPWTAAGLRSPAGETQDELYYVRNWTIWLDVQILFQTARRWLGAGRGAAGRPDDRFASSHEG